jgi:hypothetical protein
MAISTFDGPVRSLNGFYSQGPGNVNYPWRYRNSFCCYPRRSYLLVPATCAITSADDCCYGKCWLALAPALTRTRLATIGVVFQLFFNVISAGASAQTVTCGGSDKFVGSLGVIGTPSI